jgi:hypothetical protein
MSVIISIPEIIPEKNMLKAILETPWMCESREPHPEKGEKVTVRTIQSAREGD